MQVTAQTSLQEEERKGLAHIDGQAPRRIGPDAVESGAGPLFHHIKPQLLPRYGNLPHKQRKAGQAKFNSSLTTRSQHQH
jgi:hypothetical protein